MPDDLAEWRTIITRYSLNLLADYATWTLVIHCLIPQNLPTPVSLSATKLDAVNCITAVSPYGELVNSLRRAVRMEFASA